MKLPLVDIFKQHIKINHQLLDSIITVWWLYCIVRTYFVQGPPCAYKIAVYTMLFSLYIICRILFSAIKRDAELLEIVIIASSAFEMLQGIWQLYSGHSNHYLYPITGTFFNPGPYSAAVVVGMSVAMARMRISKSRAVKNICGVIICLGFSILAVTVSRGALVALGAAAAIVYRDILHRYKWYVIAASLTAAIVLFYIKVGSAMGRTVIWRISASIFLEQPLWGYGINAFESAYAKGLLEFFSSQAHIKEYAAYADVTEYAFNDILQLAVEQGIAGLMPAAACALIVMIRLWRRSKPLFTGMTALASFSLFSYPFQLLPFQIYTVICAACAAQDCKEGGYSISRRLLTLCAALALLFVSIKKMKDINKANSEYAMIAHSDDEAFIKDYYELLPECSEDERFLFSFAKSLRTNGRFSDSNAILRKGLRVSNDPMFLMIMGNNYKDMRFYREADICYKIAFAQLPNRLYPLYQRMLLYKKMGRKEEAMAMAERIITFSPKIESPATKLRISVKVTHPFQSK